MFVPYLIEGLGSLRIFGDDRPTAALGGNADVYASEGIFCLSALIVNAYRSDIIDQPSSSIPCCDLRLALLLVPGMGGGLGSWLGFGSVCLHPGLTEFHEWILSGDSFCSVWG